MQQGNAMETSSTRTVPLRSVAAGRGVDWIGEAFALFRLRPGVWIGIVLIWLVLSLVINAVPGLGLLGPFINPIFTAGLMLGCAAQARGEPLRVEYLFAGFRSGRLGPLLMLTVWTLALALAGLVALVLGSLPVLGSLRGLAHAPPAEVLETIGTLPALLLALLALALALALAMATWFAPALIVLRGVPALEALKLSFRGCLVNWLPLLLYGLVALVVLVVAVIPLMLGLLIAIPVLVASVYTAYRDIYPEATG